MNRTEENSLNGNEENSEKSVRFWNEKANRYLIGTGIFILCLVFLLIIYITDLYLSVQELNKSELTTNILEIVKTLLFTICGYLFGRAELSETRSNKDDSE